jgi:hypothetical protein
MKNSILRDRVINIIKESDGSTAYYPSFAANIFNKLNKNEKREVRKFLLKLIDNDNLWIDAGIKSNHISTCQARTIHVCAMLDFKEAIPKAEAFFISKRYSLFDEGSFALYSAIADFKISSLLPYLKEDLDSIDWLAKKAKFQSEEKLVKSVEIGGRVWAAFRAINEIDPSITVEFLSRHIDSIEDINDARLDLIVSAYYRKYGENYIEYLFEKAKGNPRLACGLIYGMYEVWKRIPQQEELMRRYFMLFGEEMQKEIAIIIENDIQSRGESNPRVGHIQAFPRAELQKSLGVKK